MSEEWMDIVFYALGGWQLGSWLAQPIILLLKGRDQ